jgi:protein-tyrosine phosphatase
LLNNILIICVGNICRSPMAEGLLKQALVGANRTDYQVSSAGLGALIGHQADASACQLMARKGIDISGHRARQLDTEMIRGASLVLVMDLKQKTTIIENEQSARGKVYRLGEWGNFDIADPYGQKLVAFEEALVLIEQGISQWMEKL